MKNSTARAKKIIKRVVLIIVIFAISLICLMPMLWIISTSLRLPTQSVTLPPHFLPTEFYWSNYTRVFDILPFLSFLKNSVIVTVIGTGVQVFISSLAAYAFARIDFPGKKVLFIVFLSGLMIPAQVTVIPKFLMLKGVGLLNTLWALILPAIIDPLAIFLLRQNMLTIPKSYDESAYMDGAGRFRIYRSIIFPMCAPSIVVVLVTRALVLWNDFFQPLIFISEYKNMTLPLGLTVLKGQAEFGSGSISIVLAGVVMSFIPPLLLYIFCQKKLMSATVLAGLKS